MDQVIPIIQAIMNGVKSPVKAGVGALIALFLYFFVLVQKGQLRARKADSEKDEQKGETNTELENTNAEASTSVRDRLNRKEQPKQT
jgi:hypothetical protein